MTAICTPCALLRRVRSLALAGLLALAAAGPVVAGPTLDAVRARGQLVCGVNTTLVGFSAPDAQGRWQGFDVDICRAVAAAVLGSAEKVRFVPLTAPQRFGVLQSGEIDLLSRNTTITLARDASMGLQMTAIAFYDGQGFMVPATSKVRSALELKNKSVCVQQGSTTIRSLTEYARVHKLNIRQVVFDRFEDANATYFAGKCDAYTSDASQLASLRVKFAANPADHVILPEVIAKEPLGPLVRRGDDEWVSIVRWVLYGLIEAEELGVTAANVEALQRSADPTVLRVVGAGEDTGKLLGLDREWLARAVRATGNYGEIFERNLGPRTPVGLPRGLNNLWNKGGLQYALPVR
ncbi:amino acid ABC transporter substrate-binding protein [Pseudorhodoferax sp. Leaf274]|uniref:amino acid ABC transporter substrate-binding protein n=1 Tax=Pseudorhodoferax sp. Leaf274 TaxID=1736318 RepID=UPI000702BDE3|nr:amino acid ABC transporter substrate-binding protein [Pseudorhodoferax sp. Leaf274]KQP43690.1 amino acid ABC transporter substrate-binding protein [Pseudorhodoferax sp. Leaf274]